MTKIFERYADFLVENMVFIFIISILVIVFTGIQATNLEMESSEYRDTVPDDIDVVEALDFIGEEFRVSGESANIVLEVDPNNPGSDEIRDVRDPDFLRYMNILGQQVEDMEDVSSVDSLATRLIDDKGRIPHSKYRVMEFIEENNVTHGEPVDKREILSESVEGLEEIEEGLDNQAEEILNMEEGLEETEKGLEDTQRSIDEIVDQIDEMEVGGDVSELSGGIQNTRDELEGIQNQLYVVSDELDTMADEIDGMAAGVSGELDEIEAELDTVASNLREFEVEGDQTEQAAYEENITRIEQVSDGIGELSTGLENNLTDVSGNLSLLSSELEMMADGIGEIEESLEEVDRGVKDLGDALDDIGNFLDQLEVSLDEVSGGMDELVDGTGEIREGLEDMSEASETFSDSVSSISEGLSSLEDYLAVYSTDPYFESLEDDEEPLSYMYSDDYSVAVIRLSLYDMNQEEKEEFAEEAYNVFEVTENPGGVETYGSGDTFMVSEILEEVDTTLYRTTAFSALLLVGLLITFFLSIRYGLTVFLTIVFGEIITLGVIATLGIPISSEMSGVLTMIMAIGDDFGIQVTNRFKQELRKKDRIQAMKTTLSNVMLPMSITTMSLLIGFRAFEFGRLEFLADLGTVMSIGVFSCFLAAVTVIPVILLFQER